MDRYSLLGHVAPGATSRLEDLATESLSYLLQRYGGAREAFADLVATMGQVRQDELAFSTQARGLGGIPDLVGKSPGGEEVLLVESKFWARLTANQPTGYLRRLSSKEQGIVLFVAPEARCDGLWEELLARCSKESIEVGHETGEPPDSRAVRTSVGPLLGYVSWSFALSRLGDHLKRTGEERGAHEVWQLKGLCDRVQEGAFLSLASEGSQTASEQLKEQLQPIIYRVAQGLKEKGIFDRTNYSTVNRPGWYRSYGTMKDRIDWFIEYSVARATRRDGSLLWVGGPHDEAMVRRYRSNYPDDPLRLYEDGTEMVVSLAIPAVPERGATVRSLVSQIVDAVGLLWGSSEDEGRATGLRLTQGIATGWALRRIGHGRTLAQALSEYRGRDDALARAIIGQTYAELLQDGAVVSSEGSRAAARRLLELYEVVGLPPNPPPLR